MLTSMTLLVGLLAAPPAPPAEPAMIAPPESLPTPEAGKPLGDFLPGEVIDGGGFGCPTCHQGFGLASGEKPQGYFTWHDWWFSNCAMPQHMPYLLLEPDNYYFRPYNFMQVGQQLHNATTLWNANPRHAYTNELFRRVYNDWEAERAESVLTPEPTVEEPDDAAAPPDDDTPPEPVPPVPPVPDSGPPVPPQPDSERGDTDASPNDQGANSDGDLNRYIRLVDPM